ncbi:hypothetical protein G7Z17_g11703 [Cylindrodendrum hubeiense]|uniref:Uncharacterized protein n=1 Tax=Cylindrodendrum hubeiense TaxID=595255 RepID=A0A9P5LB15_9HYPO|nr:hypothetical protein G7Z17_g11703 [Cylindrodendrum hubeiense]
MDDAPSSIASRDVLSQSSKGSPGVIRIRGRKPTGAATLVIEGGVTMTMTDQSILADRDAYDLPRIIDRETQFLPKTKTFATFIPEGLVSIAQ